MTRIDASAALVVIDVQEGFRDPSWGASNNPACEANVARLIDAWRASGRPIVVVRHDSVHADSPLRPGQPGNDLQPAIAAAQAAMLVTKTVNSAFLGSPDLATWLHGAGIGQIVVCGIQTNQCVETTARMGGNLGFDVIVPLDATRTFDLEGPVIDGERLRASADELTRATAISLHGGAFAEVTTTDAVVAAAVAV